MLFAKITLALSNKDDLICNTESGRIKTENDINFKHLVYLIICANLFKFNSNTRIIYSV